MNKGKAQEAAAASRRIKPFHAASNILAVSVALAFGMASPAVYAQAGAAVNIHIPAQSLNQALLQLGQQTDVQIYFLPEIVQGLKAPAVSGTMTPDQALQKLLAGTDIVFHRNGKNISLSRSTSATAELPAITVTGTQDATTEGSQSYSARTVTMFGNAQSLKDIPNSVSVVTRQQMDDQNITTINDALRYTTGISSTNYTGNNGVGSAAYYNARGFPVNVALDGQAILNGIQYMSQFDMDMYDRVEVYRGPSGLLNGQGDLGGSINLVRKRPTDTLQIKSETSIGSWANYRQMVDVSGPLNKEGTLRGRVVGVAGKANSFLDGEHSREGMGYAVLEYDLDPRTTASISAGYQSAPLYKFDWGVGYDSADNLVRGPRGWSQNFAPDWAKQETTIGEANASLKHRFDNGWNAEATVLSRHNSSYAKYAFADVPDAVTHGDDYYAQRQNLTYDWLGLDAHVSGPFTLWGRKNDVLLGVNYSQENYEFKGAGQDLGIYDIFSLNIPEPDMPYTSGSKQKIGQFSVYGHINSHLTDKLSLVLGGRDVFYKQQSKTTIPMESDWNTDAKQNGKFIPYGGLIYAVTPQVSAYASYSKIFSVQTATTYTGDVLKPFTGEQFEVGFKSSFLDDRLNATVAAFRINGDDLSVGDQTHPGYSVASGAVRSQGWEAEVSGSPLPNWRVIAGYTMVNTKYTSSPDSQGQPFDSETPKHLFKLWSTYRFTKGALQGLTVGGGVYMQSSTYRIAPQYRQGGYAIYSAMVGYQFNSHLSADLTVNNLFDKGYYNRAPASLFAEYGTPRSVMLNLRASY